MTKLCREFKVLAKMHELESKGEKIWFSKLVKLLDGVVSKSDVSYSQDRMYDCGMIDMKYENVDGLWTYCWFIEDEVKSFAKQIFETSKLKR